MGVGVAFTLAGAWRPRLSAVQSPSTRRGTDDAPALVMFVLGLTGSIGMGKSTVAAMLLDTGVPVLDADAIVHAMYAPGGAGVGPVVAAFPTARGPDGGVDRAALSKAVVGDEGAMMRLEGIVHPLVEAARVAWLEARRADGAPLVALDIPLLYETGADMAVDAVAVVSAGAEAQRERVLARANMTPAKLDAILARQLPDAAKRARADFVVDTGVGIEETQEAVRSLVAALVGREGREAWQR